MILLEGATPLDDFIKIVHASNPTTSLGLTADNIIVGNITAVDPTLNKGKNTRAVVRYNGTDETYGEITVYFDRLDLTKVYPAVADGKIRIEAPQTEAGKTDLNIMEDLVSEALGTRVTAGGAYLDYSCTIPTTYTDKSVDATITIKSNSVRYVPGTFAIKIISNGRGLALTVTKQTAYPYKTTAGLLMFTGAYAAVGYTIGSGKRSSYMVLDTIDFSEVLVNGGNVSNLHSGGVLYPDVKAKIDLLLSTHGLPPLPDSKFGVYPNSYENTTGTARAATAFKGLELPLRFNVSVNSNGITDYYAHANLTPYLKSSSFGFSMSYTTDTKEV